MFVLRKIAPFKGRSYTQLKNKKRKFPFKKYGRRNPIRALMSAPRRQVEFKWYDTYVSTSAGYNSAFIQLLQVNSGTSGINVGSGASDRIGRKIQIKSLSIRCWFLNQTTAYYNLCRFMVVVDRQSNGADTFVS